MIARCPFCETVALPAIHSQTASAVLGHKLYEHFAGTSVQVSFAACVNCSARGPLAETEELAFVKWKDQNA
jgi:hypothetical protein